MTASQSESGFDIDEERRRELLNRIRYMASSGLYADHTAINAQLSLNIDYPFVSECFADEVFNTHIDEMCSRVRKEHSANSPSEAGLNTRSDEPVQVVPVRVVGEGEETWTAKAMDEGPEEERQQERKAEIAKQIAKASTGSPRSPATTGCHLSRTCSTWRF